MNKKTYIDVDQLYLKLQQHGHPIIQSLCCGRSRRRRDYDNMLKILGMKGSFVIKDKGVIVAIIDNV